MFHRRHYGKKPETKNVPAAPPDNQAEEKRALTLDETIGEFIRLETLAADVRISKQVRRLLAYLDSHGFEIRKK